MIKHDVELVGGPACGVKLAVAINCRHIDIPYYKDLTIEPPVANKHLYKRNKDNPLIFNYVGSN